MTLNVDAAIRFSWFALALVWFVGAAFTKQTVRTQPAGARLFQMAVFLLGFFLMGSDWFDRGWLGWRYIPASYPVQLAALVATVAGCLFAIWARLTLGSNWSGRATVKHGHELIVKGPYSLSRHPIYTGLLVASVGTSLAGGEWRCILGFATVVLGFILKMSQEERLMIETFPEAYPQYRRRVKAILPGLL
jgi:protein-S-isoprenylcysteine O-methyltransferase Ste14